MRTLPSAPGPVKPRKRKAPLWAKLTTAFGSVLVLVSGTGLIGSQYMIRKATAGIEQTSLLGDDSKKSTAQGGGDGLKGPIDLLLMGVDARARLAPDDLRADTIIILHIPATHDQAYLLSVPRDTEVRIPANPATGYAGGVDKVNAAFQYGARQGGGWSGGAKLLAQTLKNETGISFDGAAIINFGGFKTIIDRLGGVRMCVDQRVASAHMRMVEGKPMWLADARKSGKPQKKIWHEVGCRDMEGWEALDYARQRYGLKNGDYDRQRHQQQLIKAMAKKAQTSGVLTDISKITSLIRAAGEALVVDPGGVPLVDFALGLRGVATNDMVLLKTNSGTFSGNAHNREVFNEESKRMFEAVRQDRLAEFIFANPTVVAKEK